MTGERCFLREADALFKAFIDALQGDYATLQRRVVSLRSNLVNINDGTQVFQLSSEYTGQTALSVNILHGVFQ